MMKPVYKYLLLGVFALLLTNVLPAHEPDNSQEYTKTIKKDFPITADGTTSLHNKYGLVDVKTWDKNRVKVEVTIRVRAGSEKKAQEVFDQIHIEFENSASMVEVETLIDSKDKGWWNWGDSDRDFNVDYEVYLPKTNALAVENKYGDVLVEEIDGPVDMEVKYGNIDLKGVNNKLRLDLKYGNAKIEYTGDIESELAYCNLTAQRVGNVRSECKYSKLSIREARNIQIDSKYNTLALGALEDFQLEGKYDNIVIERVNNLNASSKYTDFRVSTIGNSANLDLEYGSVNIETVERGFGELRLIGRYTDYKLEVEEGASYQLDATADYAGIIYPKGMSITYEKDKGVYHEVEGHMGTKNARSVIKVRLDYGGLKVK